MHTPHKFCQVLMDFAKKHDKETDIMELDTKSISVAMLGAEHPTWPPTCTGQRGSQPDVCPTWPPTCIGQQGTQPDGCLTYLPTRVGQQALPMHVAQPESQHVGRVNCPTSNVDLRWATRVQILLYSKQEVRSMFQRVLIWYMNPSVTLPPLWPSAECL